MNVWMTARTLGLAAGFALLAAVPAAAQDVAWLEKNLTVHKLDNGLTFLIYESAPPLPWCRSSPTSPRAALRRSRGSPAAHMFEHMASKGTTRIGTTDAAAEKAAHRPAGGDAHRRQRGHRGGHPA